jgi:hypothetical protein
MKLSLVADKLVKFHVEISQNGSVIFDEVTIEAAFPRDDRRAGKLVVLPFDVDLQEFGAEIIFDLDQEIEYKGHQIKAVAEDGEDYWFEAFKRVSIDLFVD